MTSNDLFNLMFHQLGYTEESFAEFIMVHCNETGVSSSAIDNAYNSIQYINANWPYRHDGYQYDIDTIGNITYAWLSIATGLGMQAYQTNDVMIFISPIGNAEISFKACIDFQYGNVQPVENYPKMIKSDTKISKIFKGSTSILGMYKGTVKIF